MTLRTRRILKRIAIAIAVLIAVAVLVLLFSFVYLGRYLVYTEDGAHFSFNSTEETVSASDNTVSLPDAPVLVTGSPIAEDSMLEGDTVEKLSADEINGLYIDYETLSGDTNFNQMDLSDSGYNVLVLEMRKDGSQLLTNSNVNTLINHATSQGIHLYAVISCLDDDAYALANPDLAIRNEDGVYWVSSEGHYYLDPAESKTKTYLTNFITSLADMGFEQVILRHYAISNDSSLVYNSDSSRASVVISSFHALENAVSGLCTLGVYVEDPDAGHQLFDDASSLYVAFSDGGSVRSYMEEHADYPIVLVTSSHDTRFDDYGKLFIYQP